MAERSDIGERVTALADTLARTGHLTDPEWRDALCAVPRHLFVPPVAWAVPDDRDGYRIDRDADPDGWLSAAYENHPIITQIDDGATDLGSGRGAWTSSLSAPDVVADFLHLLNPYAGDRVLEIGTGPGWTAALLSARLGAERVTSIEVDPQVAEQAAVSLKAAGHLPYLVLGDGADGHAAAAPYDRVHVTCGVTDVPYAWVEQTRPGGVIALPWMPDYEGGHKVTLTVLGDGTAMGRFRGGCGYMMMRSQRPVAVDRAGEWREAETRLDPRRVLWAGWGADVALAGLLPGVAARATRDGEAFRLELWAEDSEAEVLHAPDRRDPLVRWRGDRDLWAELSHAFFRWVSWGEPGRERFGMTVTPERQCVWLDSPAGAITP